jgi:formate hydrogenlyase subunit 3/multisubunit Na+/H+ antiporter MnhD subunit
MPTIVGLLCVGGLIAVGVLAVATANSRLVYGASLLATLVGLVSALWHLVAGGDPTTVSLPLGLPGIGAHFRMDALSAFFLVVANLGGATASLYGLGYGEHEPAPYRVLPFFPIYLAGMNLVVLADDAFSFLLAW